MYPKGSTCLEESQAGRVLLPRALRSVVLQIRLPVFLSFAKFTTHTHGHKDKASQHMNERESQNWFKELRLCAL